MDDSIMEATNRWLWKHSAPAEPGHPNTTFLNVHISPFHVEKYLSYKNYLPAPATVSREKMGFSAIL